MYIYIYICMYSYYVDILPHVENLFFLSGAVGSGRTRFSMMLKSMSPRGLHMTSAVQNASSDYKIIH